MKNNFQNKNLIKPLSKSINDPSKLFKKKINDTLIANHSKKAKLINIKRILLNPEAKKTKTKTAKNSRKYKYNIIYYVYIFSQKKF